MGESTRLPDVVVAEDVWGSPFDELTARWGVTQEADLWADPQRLRETCRGARALVVRNRTQVDKALLDACSDLLIVARAGVGLDNIDVETANAAGVVVSAPLGANARSVAEHALGLSLALAQQTPHRDREVRGGSWDRRAGRELCGGTWGLLGAGATARECGRLASALGMTVLAYDPYVDPDSPALREAGIRVAPLTEVIAASDVVSCHLPATAETTGMINEQLLARFKRGALFVNVGRGEVVDEDALADALESGQIAGAGLDVRATEPPTAGRLETLPNTVLTPHIAGITGASQNRILQVLASDIAAVLGGEPARSAVGTATKGRVS